MKLTKMVFYGCILFLLVGCNPTQKSDQGKTNSQKNNHAQSEVPADKKKDDLETKTPNKNNQQFQDTSITIQRIVAEARNGTAPMIPFVAHKHTITDVKKAWGNPDIVDFAGGGYYATYKLKHAVFGYTKEGLIFDIRLYSPPLPEYTISSIKQVLGNPKNVTNYNDDKIFTYDLNSKYQLRWIITNSTGKLNHISIYSPNDISTPETTGSYILTIKGTSQKLSTSAWKSMLIWRQDILAFPRNFPNDVFVNGPNKKMVALTFDDGPDLINTPKIIEDLKQQNVKGTFFFIGQKVQKYPEIVKSAYLNGNVIANHSFYHKELPKESAGEIQLDIEMTSKAIRQVIGKEPTLFRPPYGETDDKLVTIAKNDLYKIIIWSIDTLDWSQREQSHIQQNVLGNVRNGDIILMHSDEDKTETSKSVPGIIEELKRRGFQIVDLPTLLNTSPYK